MNPGYSVALEGPPADFEARSLPIRKVQEPLVRVHPSRFGPIYFSREDYRFSGPGSPYPVCYASVSLLGAFAETCLSQYPDLSFAVSARNVWAHSHTLITLSTPLALVDLTGNKLVGMGTTLLINSTDQYDLTQQWAAAIHDHPSAPDGIYYQANHAGGERSVAIFDHARDHLVPGPAIPFANDDILDDLLDALGVALIY